MNNQTPYDTDTEKNVLSCIFSFDDLDDLDSLSEDNFFTAAHKDLFSILKSMPKPVDTIQVVNKLKSAGTLDSCGGPAYISEISGTAKFSFHFKSHVKKLHELTARRAAIKAAGELMEAAYNTGDPDAFIELSTKPMQDIAEIASATTNERTKRDVLVNVMENLKISMESESGNYGMLTKIHEIDTKFLGLHTSQISVISAYPTGGKTQLAVQILWAIARQQIPALMLTIEMRDVDIAFRNLAISTSLPVLAFSRPFEYARQQGNSEPDKKQKDMMKKGIDRIQNNPIHWADAISPRIDRIISKIRRYVRVEKVKIVAVDYIQLIHSTVRDSKEQQIAQISHAFMELAKELDIHIMLLSQQNKDGDTKYARAIEEDAHLILSIKLNEETKEHMGITCKKDRNNGRTGELLDLVLDKENLVFVPKDFLNKN